MKYIFDFDDVLFKNTEMLKPRIFKMIADSAGITEKEVETEYYIPEARDSFSLMEFIMTIFQKRNVPENKADHLFQEIMVECRNFLNMELLEEVKKINKEDLFIVTTGKNEWNWSKLTYSGILEYFNINNIRVVSGDKGEAISKICDENKEDEILFVDDKTRFVEELNSLHIPNLTCVKYEQGKSLSELMEKEEMFESHEMRKLR
jgi:hypothetical protein